MKKSSPPTTTWRLALPFALLALGAAGWFLWPQQSRSLSTDEVPGVVAEEGGGRTRMLNTEVVLMRRARTVAGNLDDADFREEMLERDNELIVAREQALRSRRRRTTNRVAQPEVWFAERAASLNEAAMLDEGDPGNPQSVVTAAKLALQQMREDAP